MDGTHLHLSVTTFLSFLVLILLQASVPAQSACSVPEPISEIEENNEVNALVATITLQDGATVSLDPPEGPDYPFKLSGDGTQLLAAAVLDREETSFYNVKLMCHPPSAASFSFIIYVEVKDVNDNPPTFEKEVYKLNVSELSPENTDVGRINANDADGQPLYYRLDGETHGFKLQSPTVPLILVQTPPNYDTVKNVSLTLYVQDTPLTTPGITPSHNTTTIVEITVLDVDNRPPWFQPCTKHASGVNVICTSSGYTGQVTLNKSEPGFLNLTPGPLYAIDGDEGIQDEIAYSILGGDDGNLFVIDPNTGNMSMRTEATALGTITLTVLAAQKSNDFQATSTSVTISVVSENLHPPRFENGLYQGTVTGVGNMALDLKNEPLQFIATDGDYAATGGFNPNIVYSIKNQSDFSIIGGYLFMTKNLPAATLDLTVEARDTSNGDTDEAELQLEVKSAPVVTTPGPTPSTTADSVSSPSSNTPPGGTSPTGIPTKPTDPTGGTGPTPTPSGTTKPIDPTDGTGPTPTPSETTKPTGPTDGTRPTPDPSETTKPTGPTDGTRPTPDPSETTKPTGPTDGTRPTPDPSGTTKPTDPTDGTRPTPDPSGTTKPTGPTDGTRPTPDPSGTTKPTGPTDGTRPTPDPSGTTKPTGPTDGTGVTTTPSRTTSDGSDSTVNTPRPPNGGYGAGDMAALGATLGILLCGCLVVIAFLITRIRRDKGDWKKIYESNKFRSNLNNGFGGEKEGIQYANHAFINDEDASSTRSGSSDGGSVKALKLPSTTAQDLERYVTPKEISAPLQKDTASQSGSDGDDKEKEVKPILTKGRRQDDGYKSVWFKEDISPEAKEVVIIPDSRENDTDVEEQEQTDGNREDNERGNSDTKRPKARVGFKDDKSNRGGEDSQDDEVLAINL